MEDTSITLVSRTRKILGAPPQRLCHHTTLISLHLRGSGKEKGKEVGRVKVNVRFGVTARISIMVKQGLWNQRQNILR